MYYFGIDFGTTNCSIAYTVDSPQQREKNIIAVDVIPFEVSNQHGAKSFRMPSLVAWDESAGSPLFGWNLDAKLWQRQKKQPHLTRGATFFPSIKSDMGSNRVYPAAAQQLKIPPRVAAGVMQQLLVAAGEKIPGFDPEKYQFVVTVPASCLALARRETIQAAVVAGIPEENVELLDEPIAALLDCLNDAQTAAFLDEEPKNLLVFDYGGGTCDLSLVRAHFNPRSKSGLSVVNLAISKYTRLGGDDIDRAIMRQVVWPALGVQQPASSSIVNDLEDVLTCTVARRLKESLCDRINAYLKPNKDVWDCGLKSLESEPTDIPFPIDELPGHPKKVVMTYGQFYELMQPFVEIPSDPEDANNSLFGPIFNVLGKAGLQTSDLQVLVLHGGSCKNPFVHRMMVEGFSQYGALFPKVEIRTTPDLDASVARGAALHAYWKHARHETIVAPITSEAMGIRTLGDVDRQLVAAGTPLPHPQQGMKEIEETFYVPSTGIPEMIVPYCIGTSPKPRLAGAVKIPLEPGTEKGTKVRIRLQITENKVLHWRFQVGEAVETEAPSVDNPWTKEDVTPAIQNLLHLRESMRFAVEHQRDPTTSQFLDEIWQLFRMGGEHLHEAWRDADGFVKRHPDTPEGWNLLGCLCGAVDRPNERIRCLNRAIELEPDEPAYRSNMAWALMCQQKYDEAIAHLRTALAKTPEVAHLYEALGAVYRQKGEEAAALHEFQQGIRVIEHMPFGKRDVQDWSRLANLYQHVADYKNADMARGRAARTETELLIGGRPEHVIASQDSGIWSNSEVHAA